MSGAAEQMFRQASWDGDWESAAIALRRELEAVRERLDHYEKGRCCVKEPPQFEDHVVIRSTHGAWETGYRTAEGWFIGDTLVNYVPDGIWYPLPGGRGND